MMDVAWVVGVVVAWVVGVVAWAVEAVGAWASVVAEAVGGLALVEEERVVFGDAKELGGKVVKESPAVFEAGG
jgi:hypothetical protein